MTVDFNAIMALADVLDATVDERSDDEVTRTGAIILSIARRAVRLCGDDPADARRYAEAFGAQLGAMISIEFQKSWLLGGLH